MTPCNCVPRMCHACATHTDTWPAVIKRMHQMHICGAALDLCLDWRRHPVLSTATGSYSGFNRAVATVLTLHGLSSKHQAVEVVKRGDSPTATSAATSAAAVLSEAQAAFAAPELYASWSHNSPSLVCSSNLPLNGLEKGASLLSNGQGILRVSCFRNKCYQCVDDCTTCWSNFLGVYASTA